MPEATASADDVRPALDTPPRWRRLWSGRRRRHWALRTGFSLFVAILLVSALAPLLCPHDPATQSLMRRLAQPSMQNWLGTDHLGRDVASRLMMGGRFALVIAAVTLLLSCAIGTIIGVFSARRGGGVDEVAMRAVDLLISFPDVVVAVFLIALLGPGTGTLILALTLVGWTPFARLARGLALEINSRDYIRAAEVLGCSQAFIIFRHVIPNAARPIAAISFLRFGHKLITVGGLSFIGLGVQPPTPDWAAMMAEAQPFIERAPWLVLCPGLAIFLTALSVTWIGQGLEAETTLEAT
jgi:ABC-type dipeptide/oligopeptide/nickel transport system permease subunit